MDEFLTVFIEQFNNREIATVLWLFLSLLVWVIYTKKSQSSFRIPFGVFIQKSVLVVFSLLLLYISLVVFGLEKLNFWTTSDNLKDTIVWTITVAFVSVISVSNVSKEDRFFQKTIKDSLKIAVILEFIIALYPFSLPIEIVLIPVLASIGGMLAVADRRPEHLLAAKILRWILAFIGMIILWKLAHDLLANIDTFFTIKQLINFTLPIILTILFFPFIYFLALSFEYEKVFSRLKKQNHDAKLIRYAKYKIYLYVGFNLRKLNKWSKQNPSLKVTGKGDVLELTKEIIKPTNGNQRTISCSANTYRHGAEPLMEKFKEIVTRIEFRNADSCRLTLEKLNTLQRSVNRVPCKNDFPLKHETLEFAIKHFLEALDHASRHDYLAANQAQARSLLNQRRFDNWSVDTN